MPLLQRPLLQRDPDRYYRGILQFIKELLDPKLPENKKAMAGKKNASTILKQTP